jgi:hypothetical protein
LPKVHFVKFAKRREVRKPIAVGDGDKKSSRRQEEIVRGEGILSQFKDKITGVFGKNEHQKKDEVTVYLRQAVFLRRFCVTT